MKKRNVISTAPKIIRNLKKISNTIMSKVIKDNRDIKDAKINKISNNTINILNSLDVIKGNNEKVYILGGGPSLKNFDFKSLKGKDVIAINKSIEYLDYAKYFITIDYTYLNKSNLSIDEINQKTENSIFVLNNNNNIKLIKGVYTDTRFNLKYDKIKYFNHVIISNSEINNITGFGKNLKDFQHGNNSGYCAIQLALLLGYKEIYLLGFDFTVDGKHTHFHNSYNQNNVKFKSSLNKYKNNLIKSVELYKPSNLYTCSKNNIHNLIKYVPYHISLRNNEHVIERNKIDSTSRYNDLRDVMFVAYYTINTPYEKEAKKLIKSLKKLNLKHDVVGVPNLGDWQANTRFKAKFMLDMLEKHKEHKLVYVDSDAIIHKIPSLFSNYDCDISVRWQDFRWRKNECLSGTIYMDNNENTRELCRRWLQINDSEGPNAKTFEQWNLGTVINEMAKEGKITTKNLPPEYTFIFDSMRQIYPNTVPVIEHFQASRKYRADVSINNKKK